MNHVSIVGERVSGTNWLGELIRKNFIAHWFYINAERHKHFWGYPGCKKVFEKNKDIPHIFIVRNPYDWISSFFKKKHHQHSRCNLSFERFILDEFFSDDGEIELKDKEGNFLDRKENNERFKNIFEMRDYKNRYALEVLPNILNNYYIVRYEDLLENTEQILHELRFKFNLPKRIDEYVIDKINPSVKHIPDHINQIIKNNLNEELENKLGYSI
jgi:hypothetical protein